jgi:hypothetical protein
VILFASSPRVAEFFDLWSTYFRAGDTKFDQVSLVEAVFRSSCRVLSLDARWNAVASWGAERPQQKRYILHYMHGIDARIERQLLQLDQEVFAEQDGGDPRAPGRDETAAYIRRRQAFHMRSRARGLRRRWLNLLHLVRRRMAGRSRDKP